MDRAGYIKNLTGAAPSAPAGEAKAEGSGARSRFLERLAGQRVPGAPSPTEPQEPGAAPPEPKLVDLSKVGGGQIRLAPREDEEYEDVPRTERDVPYEVKVQKRKEAGFSIEKRDVDHTDPLDFGGTNAGVNLMALTKREHAHKTDVQRDITRRFKSEEIGQREAIVSMRNWRYYERPDMPAFVNTPMEKALNFGRTILNITRKPSKNDAVNRAIEQRRDLTVLGDRPTAAPSPAMPTDDPIRSVFRDTASMFGSDTYRAYMAGIQGIEGASMLLSVPLAALVGAVAPDATAAEVAGEEWDMFKKRMGQVAQVVTGDLSPEEIDRPVQELATDYVREIHRSGGKIGAEDILILADLGMYEILGDPILAVPVAKTLKEVKHLLTYRKAGEGVLRPGVRVTPRAAAPDRMTRIRGQRVDVQVTPDQKLRFTPTKEGSVIVEGYVKRGDTLKKTSTRMTDGSTADAAKVTAEIVAKDARTMPGAEPMPVGEVKTAPGLFQMSRVSELNTGLLDTAGAEPKRMDGYMAGGFRPELIKQDPILLGLMRFDDEAAGVRQGDIFLISGHNRLGMVKMAGLDALDPDMYRVREYDLLGDAVRDSVLENVEGKVTAYDHNIVGLLNDGIMSPDDLIHVYGGDTRKAQQITRISEMAQRLPGGAWQNAANKLAIYKDVDQRLVDRKLSALDTAAKTAARFPQLLTDPQYSEALSKLVMEISSVGSDRAMKTIENRIAKLAETKSVGDLSQTDLFGALAAKPEVPAEKPTVEAPPEAPGAPVSAPEPKKDVGEPEPVEKPAMKKKPGVKPPKTQKAPKEAKPPKTVEKAERPAKPEPEGVKALKIEPPKPKKQQSDPGMTYGDNAAYGEFRGADVQMGGMDKVYPLQMPELVDLVRELTEKVPRAVKMKKPERQGQFKLAGREIELNRNLFRPGNEQQAAATLAHEIGHLIDFLPDGTTTRGNVLGHLFTLRKFLQGTFGDGVPKDRDLREQLKFMSAYWRPFDDETATDAFLKYRNSSKELYADAISILLNSPKEALVMAPDFYRIFFDALDRKQEVKKSYFKLMELVSGGDEALFEKRWEYGREMFTKADDLAQLLDEERKRKVNVIDVMRRHFSDLSADVKQKELKLNKEGKYLAPADSPIVQLDELLLVDNEIAVQLTEIQREVIDPLQEAGIDLKALGNYLFHKRITGSEEIKRALDELIAAKEAGEEKVQIGDEEISIDDAIAETAKGTRASMANPGGHNRVTSQHTLDQYRERIGDEKWKLLEEKAQRFHEIKFRSVEEAVRVGSYNRQLYEKILLKNKNNYVTFRVIEYLSENVSPGVIGQHGTFKEIENPLVSTLAKTAMLNRLNAHQRAKNAFRDMMLKHYTDEIRRLPEGKRSKPGMGSVMILENGRPVSYEVDPYIASSFDRVGMIDLELGRVINNMLLNPLFKNLHVLINVSFQSVNLVRDFKRSWRNLNALGVKATMPRVMKEYVRALPVALRRARGLSDGTVEEMLRTKALDQVTMNDLFALPDPTDTEDMAFRKLMERHHLVPPPQERNALSQALLQIFNGLRALNTVIETLPKVAGYRMMKEKLAADRDLGFTTRTYVGTPNFRVKGRTTHNTNAIALYSNIMIQSIKADGSLAIKPKTRSGFWWKIVQGALIPKLIMYMAALGLLGTEAKRRMDSVPEYHKTNYIIVPLGDGPDGQPVALRLPMDETERMISGMFWKMLNLPTGGLGRLQDILSYSGGQLPGPAPLANLAMQWSDFLSGRNPYDRFYGRLVIPQKIFEAGGIDAWTHMAYMTIDETGLTRFRQWDKDRDSWFELMARVTPILNRYIYTGEYGLREKEKELTGEEGTERARRSREEDRILDDRRSELKETDAELLEGYAEKFAEDVVREVDGTSDSASKKYHLRKKFMTRAARLRDDWRISTLMEKDTNDQKIATLRRWQDEMPTDEFELLTEEALKYMVISDTVYEEVAE